MYIYVEDYQCAVPGSHSPRCRCAAPPEAIHWPCCPTRMPVQPKATTHRTICSLLVYDDTISMLLYIALWMITLKRNIQILMENRRKRSCQEQNYRLPQISKIDGRVKQLNATLHRTTNVQDLYTSFFKKYSNP